MSGMHGFLLILVGGTTAWAQVLRGTITARSSDAPGAWLSFSGTGRRQVPPAWA